MSLLNNNHLEPYDNDKDRDDKKADELLKGHRDKKDNQ